MINIVKGDLLSAKETLLVHQCNDRGVMGSGVARPLRNKYPEIFAPYHEFCQNNNNPLGTAVFVPTHDGKVVGNLIGQKNYGRNKNIVYTQYDAIQQCFHEVYRYAKEHKLTVAAPYLISCGLANGDWDVVYPMMEGIFTDVDLTLYKL